jgi:hypothetical protein
MKLKSKILAPILLLMVFSQGSCKLLSGPPLKPAPVKVELPRSRFVVVLRDASGSFKSVEQSNKSIEEIINNLGPLDSLLLIDISSTFAADQNVKVQASLSDVPQDIFNTADKVIEWRKQQTGLDNIWQDVENEKAAIINYLQSPVESSAHKTDLYTALEYVALRLSRELESEKRVYCFTDLIYEAKGVKTDLPPKVTISFKDAQIAILFVPFEQASTWQAKEKAWRDWFVNQCGATSFAMFDPAQSAIHNPLPPNQVPRKLKSPFGE